MQFWQPYKHSFRASNAFLGNYLTATPYCTDDIFTSGTGEYDELMPAHLMYMAKS